MIYCIVLDGCACQQHHTFARETPQRRQDLRLLVLQSVSLVDHHKLERNGQDQLNVLVEHLIGRNQHLKLVQLAIGEDAALRRNVRIELLVYGTRSSSLHARSIIIQDCVERGPLLHRPLPVRQCGERRHHQERTTTVLQVEQVV